MSFQSSRIQNAAVNQVKVLIAHAQFISQIDRELNIRSDCNNNELVTVSHVIPPLSGVLVSIRAVDGTSETVLLSLSIRYFYKWLSFSG